MKYKLKTTAIIVSTIACTLLMFELSPSADANSSGAPAGTTGSPGDGGKTCSQTGCHTGSPVTPQTGLITSNIPNTGYLAGQTYTITASIATAGCTKYGFQISPQNISGTKEGTIIITNSNGTQLLSNGKYITHKQGGTSFISGTASWSFDWTAPTAAGTGDITFYGAFNSTNSSNTVAGDNIATSTLTVSEAINSGIANPESISYKEITFFPNPFTDNLTIKTNSAINDKMQISIIDTNGKVVKKLIDVANNQSLLLDDLAKGYYVFRIEIAGGVEIKKIVKE